VFFVSRRFSEGIIDRCYVIVNMRLLGESGGDAPITSAA